MKTLFLALSLLFSSAISAQSAYESAMAKNVQRFESAQTPETLTALSNDFTRIADKEKSQWLPYYYAAYATIEKGRVQMRGGDVSGLDAVSDEAQKNVDKALALSPDNAELLILQKMIHGLRMIVDPQTHYMTEAASGAQALAKAEKLDPENPRITLLRAEDTYYTPEQFGGSKEKGLALFQKALEQYNNYQPAGKLYPSWGKGEAEYFLQGEPKK